MAKIENVLVPEPVVGEGNTVSAWTLVLVVTVGLIVATVGFSMLNFVIMNIGIAVMVVGLLLGGVLKAAGYGKDGKHTKTPVHH